MAAGEDLLANDRQISQHFFNREAGGVITPAIFDRIG